MQTRVANEATTIRNSDRGRIHSIADIRPSYRFDGPSPTIVSRIVPQNVRCGGKIARGSFPGTTPAGGLFDAGTWGGAWFTVSS